jgi:hypothetical protein
MRRRWTIESADCLQPHDHVAWFGDGVDELFSVASEAFTHGARHGEKLWFVADDPDPARLQGVGGLIAGGQLELFSVDAVYGSDGAFSASEQLATFESALAGALSDGYSGIRVVANNTRLVSGDGEGFRRWLAWEALTDRFQSTSMVTGVCFFDQRALSDERRADLAALHPVCCAQGVAQPFSMFADGDAIVVTGTLNAACAEQFRRMLDAAPVDGPLVVDLTDVLFEDFKVLYALAGAASADRPIRIQGDEYLRRVVSMIGFSTPHLRFASTAKTMRRCVRCGDAIGAYEPASIMLDGTCRETSAAADPAAFGKALGRYHRACIAA